MRTIEGPFCSACGEEVMQQQMTDPASGYLKWIWVHRFLGSLYEHKVTPDWRLK